MKIRASLPAAFAFLLVAGFAATMPTSFHGEDEVVPVVTPEATETPEPEETEDPEELEEEVELDDDPEGPEGNVHDGERADNHGLAVSTAAKCGVTGPAHGELVRSIAQDPSATAEDAAAACDAALAAQEAAESAATAPTAKVKGTQGPQHPADRGKQGPANPSKGGPPDHAGPSRNN